MVFLSISLSLEINDCTRKNVIEDFWLAFYGHVLVLGLKSPYASSCRLYSVDVIAPLYCSGDFFPFGRNNTRYYIFRYHDSVIHQKIKMGSITKASDKPRSAVAPYQFITTDNCCASRAHMIVKI